MKKVILSLASIFLLSTGIIKAQYSVYSDLSDGYLYTAGWADCVGERSYAGGSTGKSDVLTIPSAGLTVTCVAGHPAYGRTPTYIPMVYAPAIVYSTPTNCSNVLPGIDLTSLPAAQQIVKVTMYASSNVNVRVHVASGPSSFPCGNNNYASATPGAGQNEFAVTTTAATYTVDLSSSAYLLSTCASPSMTIDDLTHIGISPDVENGNFAGTVVITRIEVGNAPADPFPEINLKQGTTTGTDVASGASATAFPDVTSGSTGTAQTFTIQNTGTANLKITAASITGTDAADFTLSSMTFPVIISAGGSQTFTVTFAPTTVGSKSATIELDNNDADEGTYTVDISANSTATTAVSAAIDNSLISVYPNPAKEQINIDLSSLNSSNASVKIMNANGMLVYQGTASNSVETINSSSFNKGIYVVQVASDSKVSTKRIVIE